MCHRRPVQWLWVDADGVPAKEIYQSDFTQATIYRLKKDSLNIPALERYMNSGRSGGTNDARSPSSSSSTRSTGRTSPRSSAN